MATHEVGHCELCGIQWVIRGESDKQACPFCGASDEAVTIEDESGPQDDLD